MELHAADAESKPQAAPGRYWFTGGGTGGHVTPNLALIAELRARDPKAQILYAGTRRGFESRVVEAGIPFLRVPCAALTSPRRPLRFLQMLFKILLGTLVALVHVLRFRPDVVIASGGYVSVPSVLAAWILRRRIYVHEQNVDPGRANRLLGQLATQVSVTFAKSLGSFRLGNAEHTGYPLRGAITAVTRDKARANLGLKPSDVVVAVVGGSMGARAINQGLVDGLPELLASERLVIYHATGLAKGAGYNAHEDTMRRVAKLTHLTVEQRARYRAEPFFDNIGTLFAAADLVVARAGAGTIMELAAMGKAALLIPKTGLPGEHQLRNALTMKEAGSADILYEELSDNPADGPRVSGKLLAQRLRRLTNDPETLQTMGQNAKKIAVPDATERHVDRILALRAGDVAEKAEIAEERLGILVDASGERHELLFRAHRVGTARGADLTLDRIAGSEAANAMVVRLRSDSGYQWRIQGLGGTVSVDGVAVTEPVPLKPGAKIAIGSHPFEFAIEPRTIRREAQRKGLAFGSILTAGGVLLSRMAGFVRDLVLAVTFGAGAVADLWFLGLQVANWLRGVFAEVAIDSAFMPTYLHLLRTGRADRAQKLLGSVAWITLIGTGSLTLLGILTLPIWLPWIAAGFAERGLLEEAILVTRVMFPYLILVSLAALASAVLRAADRYTVAATSSVWFSVGALLGFASFPALGPVALGVGVLFGGLLQLLCHWPSLRSVRVRDRIGWNVAAPSIALKDPAVKKVRRLLPVILAEVSVLKLGAFVDLALAARLGLGSVAAMGLAMTLFRLPYGVLSQSLNLLVLRRASDLNADGDGRNTRLLLEKGVAWTAFMLLPISVILFVLAEPMTRLLLQYGQFSAGSTRLVAGALQGFSFGLVGWGLMSLSGRMLHARMDQASATRTSLIALGLNIGLSIGFFLMNLGLFGIALATSISYLIGAGLRLGTLCKRLRQEDQQDATAAIRMLLIRHLLAIVPAICVMAAAKVAVMGYASAPLFIGRLAEFGIPAIFGLLAYVAAGVVLRLPAFAAIERRFSKPGERKRPVGAPPINPYCLQPPERLLRWIEAHPEAARNFELGDRVQQLMGSRDWSCRNTAVKLASKLGDERAVHALTKLVRCRRAAPLVHRLLGGDFREPGFVRRNAVTALATIGKIDEEVEQTLLTALQDPYWEVRSAACRALAGFVGRLSPETEKRAIERLMQLAKGRNFEAAQDSVRALGTLARDRAVLPLFQSLHYHLNWRVRRALVLAYQQLFDRGVLNDRKELLERLDDILVTSEGFVPRFELKECLAHLRRRLTDPEPGALH